jgi:two-component sensor histidine kinase
MGTDGTWRWHETTMTPVEDDRGCFLHFVGVSRDITARKSAEEALARQLAEKETLLREVHHRVKNNVASIGSFLSLQAASAVGEEAKAMLEAALARVQSMGVLYDRLLLSGEYQGIGMKDYLEGLIDSILEIFPKDAAITLDTRIADIDLDPKKAVSVGIILNELLTNALKYAFVGRSRGRILISLTKRAQKAELVVQDDGVGLPAAIDRATPQSAPQPAPHDPPQAPQPASGSGFGLTLVSMLAEQLGGSLVMESGAGTTSTLTFES